MPLQNPDSHIFLIFFLLFGTLFVATALGMSITLSLSIITLIYILTNPLLKF